MSMEDYKIQQSEIANRRVQDAPDQPQGTAQEVKALFDELSLNLIIPAFNRLVDALAASMASGMLGAVAPDGLEGSTVQEVLEALNDFCKKIVATANEDRQHVQKSDRTAQQHYQNRENPHKVTKEQVGLGNCDNTADMDKPVSRAQKEYTDKVAGQAALGTLPDNSVELVKLVPAVQALIRNALQQPETSGKDGECLTWQKDGSQAWMDVDSFGLEFRSEDDFMIQSFWLKPTGTGWNEYQFAVPFDEPPSVVLQIAKNESYRDRACHVEVSNVTKTGFQYCVYVHYMRSWNGDYSWMYDTPTQSFELCGIAMTGGKLE